MAKWVAVKYQGWVVHQVDDEGTVIDGGTEYAFTADNVGLVFPEGEMNCKNLREARRLACREARERNRGGA